MVAIWQRTAKRAPKLASCPSISSVISKIETKPINPTDVNHSFLLPELSDSKWWLQLQSDYMCQRGLTSVKVNDLDPQNPHQFVENQDYSSINSINSLSSKESYEFVKMDSVEIPWWQVAESDDLGSFVSKKSHILIESCDLDRPMHTGLEPRVVKHGQTAISRGGSEHDTSKTKILEALCRSQTRAREAEIAVKKAYEEKQHAIKILLTQAAQLFAYKQWIYVLQIENLCYQMKKNNYHPIFEIGKLDENMKTVGAAKGKRTRTEHGFGRYERDLRKYAVVFVVGLGIVGAGLVFGWSIGWMLI